MNLTTAQRPWSLDTDCWASDHCSKSVSTDTLAADIFFSNFSHSTCNSLIVWLTLSLPSDLVFRTAFSPQSTAMWTNAWPSS